MLEDGIKITKQAEESKYEQDGTRISLVRVEFFVQKHGPFVERFLKDEYTGDKRDATLNTFAREVRT